MTSRTCNRCGAPVTPGKETRGLCARCLLQAGMDGGSSGVVYTRAGGGRPTPPEPGKLLEHFPELDVQELVGQGGMGAVYRAVQPGLGRNVALKILLVPEAGEAGFAERFEREARALASLSHTNIVGVHDFGRRGPYWFLTLEYVDGANLRQMLQSETLNPRTALGVVGQVCDALQYAHDMGVVHRDIKPENILVDRTGRVRILDFGLAKLVGTDPGDARLTQSMQALGTPHYMAPEQWERPLEVDHRADLYSLGVVLYELLTGELPVGRFPMPSERVQVDVRLDEVVLKTLEKQPEKRYQQASEIKTAVNEVPSGVAAAAPAMATAGGADEASPRKKDRRGLGCLGVALICLLVLFGLGGGCVAFYLVMTPRFVEEPNFEYHPPEAVLRTPRPVTPEAAPEDAPEEDLREAPILRGQAPAEVDPSTLRTDLGDDPRDPGLQRVLDEAFDEYLALEQAHTQSQWQADGRLRVTIEAFREERAELGRRLAQRVAEVAPGWNRGRGGSGRFLTEMPYGARPVTLVLWQDSRGFHVQRQVGEEEPTESVTSDGFPPADVARFYLAALDGRAVQPLTEPVRQSHGFVMTPEFARELGLEGRQVDEALRVLELARRGYLGWLRDDAVFEWEDDALIVRVPADSARVSFYHRQAWKFLVRLVDDPSREAVLHERYRREAMMPYGGPAAYDLRISRRGDSFRVVEARKQGPVLKRDTTDYPQLPPRVQLLWDIGQERRGR